MNQSKTTLSNINPNSKKVPSKKEDECDDSDEDVFKQKENEKKGSDDGEELSDLTADSIKDDVEGRDFLYAQYDKVHRIKNKWKCSFKDAVLQINGKEYIFDKICGELERDW